MQPPLEASIDIEASPDAVWAVVSDLAAMKRWSPELVGTWLRGRPGVGAKAVNLNRRKGFVWPTTSRITRWKDPANDSGRGALAFHVAPTDVEWSYELEPLDGGSRTRLTERRTAVVDPSLVVRLTAKLALGGASSHDERLERGMKQTLSAIQSHLER
ncbi:SRPBCC family protein [Aeromicrobium sp. UC242_57]|uniref:SRPBCC family protein n=1 Tax=Aeromicrobium sp. UC242_57 TaxID=3374624 RepID=UPI003799E45C